MVGAAPAAGAADPRIVPGLSDLARPGGAPPGAVLLASTQLDMRYLLPALDQAAPGLDIRLWPEMGAVEEIGSILCWCPPAGLIAGLPRLRLVQSLAAGVDHIVDDPTLPAHLPVCRVTTPDMTSGMVTYAAWAVTHRHRHFDKFVDRSARGVWEESPIVPARLHRVGIAGLGVLGVAVGKALAGLGYDVAGWSRGPKPDLPPGIANFHGAEQRGAFLGRSDTLICLLPLTSQTRGFLCAALFAQLPAGAHLINVGRGAHLVEADLLAALDHGTLGAATLDCFAEEPLPAGHPFWRHPRITVTPHIATRASAATIVEQFLANLRCLDTGAPLDGLIDRARGY